MKRPPKRKPRALNTASLLPPELFKYICSAAGSESRSWRLVCRYWNRQCTRRVFEHIDINDSPKLIRALWKVRAHPTFKPHIKIISRVPWYTEDSKFPWIHLLTQICSSTQAVWEEGGEKACISLENRDKRIRSIHYALPRSVPQSFSCGIRNLCLVDVKFRQLEDLTHMACELPDLEELVCYKLTLGSLPAELPRRRPRKSRNKLKVVDLAYADVAIVESPMIPILSLFLSVYDAASFFSDEEVAVFIATFSRTNPYFSCDLHSTYDSDEHTRQLRTSSFPHQLDL